MRTAGMSSTLGYKAKPKVKLPHNLMIFSDVHFLLIVLLELDLLFSPWEGQSSGSGNVTMRDRKLVVGWLQGLPNTCVLWGDIALVGVTNRQPIAYRGYLPSWNFCRDGEPCQCGRFALWKKWCLLVLFSNNCGWNEDGRLGRWLFLGFTATKIKESGEEGKLVSECVWVGSEYRIRWTTNTDKLWHSHSSKDNCE